MSGGMIKSLLTAVLDAALPPRCPGCRAIVATQGSFCADCWTQLRCITRPLCAICGVPFEIEQGRAARCGACLAAPPRFDTARAAFVYGGPARDVALGLKHADRQHLATMMARHMLRAGATEITPESLVVPVPLHRWRLWRRGHNQAALLARAVAAQAGLPLLVDALQRPRATRLSAGLSRAERAKNVRGAFRLRDGARERIAGRRELLIDDLLTTGATVEACATVLRKGAAAGVDVLTWARVVQDANASHI